MSTSLFRKKSIAQIQADAAAGLTEHAQEDIGGEGGGLRRTLKLRDLTLMGIAAIIGAGIFAMIGGAAYRGGPGVIFLFVFSAIACGFSALCYADFASRIPVAGSAYTYSYASFGELFAWIIGWDLIVEYAIGNIAVAISWSDYFTRLMSGYGVKIPAYLTMDYLSASRGYEASGADVSAALEQGATIDALAVMKGDDLVAISDKLTTGGVEAYQAWTTAPMIGDWRIIADVPALVMTLLITALVFVGIRESKIVGNIMTVLKIGIILLVIVLGAMFVNTENWSPFLPNGISGVMAGVAAVFFAYIGFDALSTTAEECENPRRDLPKAMIYSLLICTVLYILLALVLTGMEPYLNLNVGDPLAFVFRDKLPWLSGVIAVSAVIALATVFLVFQIGQPRLWMAMSRDGLLPKIFSSIHPKFRTPWFSTIVTGIVVAIPALFMNLTEVTDLGVIGTLFAFTLVCGGILYKDKEFGREGRFVPYIDSRVIVPVLLLFGFITLVYLNGISALNESTKSKDIRISSVDFSEIPEADRYSPTNLSNLTNVSVYSEGLGRLWHFFDVNPESENLSVTFTMPRTEKNLGVSPDKRILLVEGDQEREILFRPDTERTERKEDRSFFGFVTEKTTTPNSEFTPPISTPNGQATVTVVLERQLESWFSAFSHKIPYMVFLPFLLVMALLCFIKRLSLIPVLGVLSCTYLMTELGIVNWTRFGIWLALGLVIYFAYGYRNSRLRNLEAPAA